MTERPPLRPYQKDGVEFLRSTPRAYLADDPGLGKSRQMIEATEGRTLVVAPAMIMDSGTWTAEVNRWADDPSRFHFATYTNLTGREPTKPRRKPDGTMTKGGFRPSKELHPELEGHWDTLILDEAHYIKNSDALRTHAIRKLAKNSERLIQASGTPIPNWPDELFVPLQLLRPKDAKRGEYFGSKWRWIDEWFITSASRFSDFGYNVHGLRACSPDCSKDPQNPCEHFHRFVNDNFGDLFLQRRRDDVLTDLPPMTTQQVWVPMTKKQSTEYGRMVKDFCSEVEDQEVIAWSSAAKNTMLDKLTSGLGLLSEDPTHHVLHSGKLDMLRVDLESRAAPTVVVAHYQKTVEACAEVARSLGLRVAMIHGGTTKRQRLAAVQGFQAGEFDVFVGSLETISEGLTLTAADMIIMVEVSYKPSRNEQAIRRIHRLGQTRPCSVREYIATTATGAPTLDERKRELLKTKTDMQTRVMTAAQFKQLLRG